MKVACVQFQPLHSNVEENLQRMRSLCPSEADLVIYPELAISGYLFDSRQRLFDLAEKKSPSAIERMIEVASANDSHIVFGFPEASKGKLYNSAALVGPDGLIDTYRKVHLFDRETLLFDPGREAWRVHDIGSCRLGMMICYDWIVPEVARTLALKGADIICHPANLVLPYCQQSMVTRCLENRVFVATCNRVGKESMGDAELTFTGGSQVMGPDGFKLVWAGVGEECAIITDVDPSIARDKQFTPHNNLFGQRVPSLYGTLTDESIAADSRPYRRNVAIVVVDDRGRVLAGERSDKPGVWQLPQGGVDEGESDEVAMLRELEEEIGTGKVDILGQTESSYRYDFPGWLSDSPIARQYRGQQQRYFVVRLKDGEQPDIEKSDGEFVAFTWLEPSELLDQIVEFKREVYLLAFEELSGLISAKN